MTERLTSSVEVLPVEVCLELLDQQVVGRLAFVDENGLSVLPVNYRRDGWTIAFRAVPGGKLVAAGLSQPVVFEVDDFDATARSGWSVVVRGVAEAVLPGEVHDRLDALGLDTWIGERASHWVRVHPDSVTGRRISNDG